MLAAAAARTGSPSRRAGGGGGGGGGGAGGRRPFSQKLDAEQLEELREAFNLFDTDNNGAYYD